MGDRTVALPTDDVRETLLTASLQIQPPQGEDELKWQISTEQGMATGYGLATFWQQSTELADTTICIRVRPTGEENTEDIWLIADDLLGQEELLIQPLPHPLVSPSALLGVSLQADGSLHSVVDPVALANTLATQHPTTLTEPDNQAKTLLSEVGQTILVVDDAALMRRRLESSLNTYGVCHLYL